MYLTYIDDYEKLLQRMNCILCKKIQYRIHREGLLKKQSRNDFIHSAFGIKRSKLCNDCQNLQIVTSFIFPSWFHLDQFFDLQTILRAR